MFDPNGKLALFRRYRRMALDRQAEHPQTVVEYGGSNPIEESNVQPAAWCLDAWALGADGVLPWQTIGRAESWRTADPLSLFYPATASAEHARASVSLSAIGSARHALRSAEPRGAEQP